MTSLSRRMIEDFYGQEEDGSRNEAFSMKFTASGQISDISMLDAIAARFGTTRAGIVSELLHNCVLEMYFGLSLKDKEDLSTVADLETTKVYEKKGITQTTVGLGLPDGESTSEDLSWRGYYAAIKSQEEKGAENADA